ncbi:NlpC/P60 family protein [Amycolatopsis thermophila]|uniref:Cell wall-associated NlpC family hydrolase n=1 Tax=Amycolatopsis thermophila TaxID=206084 RepID=A0ABU0F399_9PSEU|nr:NlpC/P60 family protein [Amycolatopsis thermophila]MDQ0381819.1 cell wall-associated NlpC family hydrolase [Amycolatopsis thermophila]
MGDQGRRARRWVGIGALALVVVTIATGPAAATPPPPPNPSDSEISASRREADAKAGEVGQLTNQLAEAESRLDELQSTVELRMEEANKALVDLQTAQDAADQAQRDADAAKREADAAQAQIDTARANLDAFISSSYQQGSTIGSISAYMGASSPKDLLARAQLLEAVSGSQLNALEMMQQAQTDKSNKDAAARQALQLAQQAQDRAAQAKITADGAQAAAVQAQQNQAAQTAQLQANKTTVEQQLFQAQQRVSGLQGQRQRYDDWLAQKQRDDEEQARQAALAAANSSSGGGGGGGHDRPSAPAVSGSSSQVIERVIARAMAQLGMPYAWGGGNAGGPTRGIRDGGVADAYGDYRKVGFDCSGLMIYAFAGVASLPHYSGYQYTSGRRVPLAQMRRGDMLFWGRDGIHHVALYLGNGMMIEAPQSGMVVRVTPVRYGDILPFATRLVG